MGLLAWLAPGGHRALAFNDVAEAFAKVESSLPADIIVNSELFRLKNFIDRGIFNVAEALVIGAQTTRPNWDGEPVDVGYVVDVLRSP